MSAVKVLLAGDCLGAFSALFKRVATVNAKSGPFDLLLCVGQFFEEAGKLLKLKADTEIHPISATAVQHS